MDLKNIKRGRISEYTKMSDSAIYFEKQRPWNVCKADLAYPCATQNEIDENDAKNLKKNGVYLVAEGANMPSTTEAINVYQKNSIMYGPAKAVNAGGVACSGLEMTQNSIRLSWTRDEVETKLHDIMKNIF